MKTHQLKAEERKLLGRKVKNIRSEGLVPGNIFGHKVKSTAISVKLDDLKKVFAEAGETGLVEIHLGKDARPVLISNIQTHPTTDDILHVDFRQVNLKEKVTATVPVELVGESPADKSGLGILVHLLDEVEVEALPTDLPDHLEVDITSLVEVENSVSVKDIKVDKSKVEIQATEDTLVARIAPLAKEEEPEPTPVEGEEGEASGAVVSPEQESAEAAQSEEQGQ